MVLNLGLKVEVVKKSSHNLVNILTAAGPSKAAHLLNEAIMGNESPVASPILPTSHGKKGQKEVLCSHSRL